MSCVFLSECSVKQPRLLAVWAAPEQRRAKRYAVLSAADSLTTRSADAESRFAAFTQQAVTHLSKHLAHRSEELARTAVEVEVQALHAIARKILQEDLGPPVQRLVRALNDSAHRRLHWPSVAVGAVTAVAASAAGWPAAIYLLTR